MKLELPTTQYIAFTEFAGLGIGHAFDPCSSTHDFVGELLDALCTHHSGMFRAFRIDLCHETNAPKSFTDITGYVEKRIRDLCAKNDWDVPAMNGKDAEPWVEE
jgi:hypothetical protein